MITSITHEANGPDKIGMSGPPLDKIVGGEFPYLNGINLLAYAVPASTRFHCKAITMSARPNVRGLANAATPNAGSWRVLVDGTQVQECLFLDLPVPFPPGYDEGVVPFYSAFQLPSMGHGFTVLAGDPIVVQATPEQNTIVVWYVTVFGKTASGVDIRSARVATSSTTANQELLSFTPAADYTVLAVTVNADMSAQYFGQARICINGNQVAEMPPMGMEVSTPTFAREDGYAGCGMGAFTLPLWDIEFGEGSLFGFEPMPFTDDDSRWTLMVAGTEESLSPTPAQIAQAMWERTGRTLTS